MLPFDNVFCLTLRKDTDRQERVKEELKKIEVDKFQFFYGATPEDPEVKEAYRDGLVKPFPTCFRCGKSRCNCDNNFLVPQQVACFVSYMRLFYYVSNLKTDSNIFLLVEDDVEFEDYALTALKSSFEKDNVEMLGLSTDLPAMISIGQNYIMSAPKSRREWEGTYRWNPHCNEPCNVTFAFNKAFAKLALHQFHGYRTTSDIYIHSFLHKRCLHNTLEPRISHDMSWSTGEFKSTIHPKKEYIAFPGRSVDEIKEEALRIKSHTKRVNSEEEYNEFLQEYLNNPV